MSVNVEQGRGRVEAIVAVPVGVTVGHLGDVVDHPGDVVVQGHSL